MIYNENALLYRLKNQETSNITMIYPYGTYYQNQINSLTFTNFYLGVLDDTIIYLLLMQGNPDGCLMNETPKTIKIGFDG